MEEVLEQAPVFPLDLKPVPLSRSYALAPSELRKILHRSRKNNSSPSLTKYPRRSNSDAARKQKNNKETII